MISITIYWPDGLDFRVGSIAIFLVVSFIFALVTALALIITSKHLANVGLPGAVDFTWI